jgi:hypothetical protein
MKGKELIALFDHAKRRCHVIGSEENGIIAGLDLEGRLFAVVNGEVLNRVVPDAILKRGNKEAYLNPGGDALWPAPEGSCYGYEYTTGKWRVPPAITGSSWNVIDAGENKAIIRAEIDLISNLQIGIPCEFERHIYVKYSGGFLIQNVTEVIRYIGSRPLGLFEVLLAPWSLCQFDSVLSSKVILPPPSKNDIWDIYDTSIDHRRLNYDLYEIDLKTDKRFQIGLGPKVPWIEFISGNGFRAKRYASDLPEGQEYVDIADVPPDEAPSDREVKLSIYSDPSGFMEIEACGGSPDGLQPGEELYVNVTTEYKLDE